MQLGSLAQSLHITIRAHFACTLIIIEDVMYILCREAKHLIELRLGGDMPTDIETTSHIIECHGADTCDKDTFKRAFELLEDVTIEALGMGHRPIHLLALFIEHGVGKVVILVS